MAQRWRMAMDRALYGPAGFYTTGAGPAAHFRTSVHASPLFAVAILRLISTVDDALGGPDRLDVVDIGAGRGELLSTLDTMAPPGLARRLRLRAVERAPRPAGLPATIEWLSAAPAGTVGLLIATEWLDNVPLDLAEDGRYQLVDQDGVESPGPVLDQADADWLARWWPGTEDGATVEIGTARDTAWARTVSTVEGGFALCVDYGHTRHDRPLLRTLTGFRDGREVVPVPNGSCDLTAHVAVDAVAAAGATVAGAAPTLLRQREALRQLGVSGARPPLAEASRDPAGYLRALAAASTAGELTDPAGLGGHYWLLQAVGTVGVWQA